MKALSSCLDMLVALGVLEEEWSTTSTTGASSCSASSSEERPPHSSSELSSPSSADRSSSESLASPPSLGSTVLFLLLFCFSFPSGESPRGWNWASKCLRNISSASSGATDGSEALRFPRTAMSPIVGVTRGCD